MHLSGLVSGLLDFLPFFSKGHDFHLLFICCRWLFLKPTMFFCPPFVQFPDCTPNQGQCTPCWNRILANSSLEITLSGQKKKKCMPAQISYFTELIGFDVEPAVHYKCSYVMKCSGLSYSCHNPMCQGTDTICIFVRCHKFDKTGVLEPWEWDLFSAL